MTDPSATVREIRLGETAIAWAAMSELRPHVGSREQFVERVDHHERPEGYRLIGSFEGSPEPVAVAGFRFLHTLAWGFVLYVDDLVTRADARGRGHGRRLMKWLEAEAREQGCHQLHLDSGHQRHDAHRLYLSSGMEISSHHFSKPLSGA